MKTIILSVLFICLTFELHAKIIYLEPVQNAKYVSIHNNIIIGFDKKIENRNLNSILKVTGTISGTHDGEIILTADKKKIIFKPNKPFAYNETVEVIIHNLKTYSFQTQIKKIENDRISNALDEYDY
ncbi:MAG: Ig-like domain-containing protein [Ignavibacteria bacterium]|nr:Ig-like domain-containing protein [Ignavibacteria bacterium]